MIYGDEDSDLHEKGYINANFQSNRDDSKSQLGYVFTLNATEVSWKSSKQETIAYSTIDVEYIVASEVAKKAVWIRKFIT